ncbi:uncharacterized protein LOC122502964 isoform X3 [Leptopilina heterotoma]|uniref:uncharacterized protein LOC122502964 isoform X3 n=1 Tax=Leptopilina heterotoma TaxID=63436 RepID=UPI001CA97F4F|nr:uncharacterized protein LOC122502964 isoform X3 [Leptopilina heterotoma]
MNRNEYSVDGRDPHPNDEFDFIDGRDPHPNDEFDFIDGRDPHPNDEFDFIEMDTYDSPYHAAVKCHKFLIECLNMANFTDFLQDICYNMCVVHLNHGKSKCNKNGDPRYCRVISLYTAKVTITTKNVTSSCTTIKAKRT